MKIFRRDDQPHWAVSLIPFLVLIATLVLVIKGFGADALSGGSQVALMSAAGITVAISMIFYKKSWREFDSSLSSLLLLQSDITADVDFNCSHRIQNCP